MDIKESIYICKEMQKWRRGKKPYNGKTPKTHRPMPYTPAEWGVAMDALIKFAEETVKAHDFFAGMSAVAGFNVKPELHLSNKDIGKGTEY